LLARSISAQTTKNVPAQYSTIQAAVDAATTGQEVVVDSGYYPEIVTITGKSGLKITGLGQSYYLSDTMVYGTVIRGVSVLNSNDIVIENLGIINTGEPSNGVAVAGWAGNVERIQLSNLTVRATDHGISIDEMGGTVSDISITNCRTYSGIHGIIGKAENVLVEGCQVTNASNYSYGAISDNIMGASVLSTAKDVTFDNCKAINGGGVALIIRGTDWSSTDNSNHVVSPQNIVINNCSLNSVSYVLQIGEWSSDSYPKCGTHSQAQPINVMVNNSLIYGSATHGLVCFYGHHVNVSNCVSFNNGGIGFYAFAGDSLMISGCQAYGNGGGDGFDGWMQYRPTLDTTTTWRM
jgi:hypothetical protein